MPDKKKCFVVMGFGKKTDYPTGRVLDLDKSYRAIIKPAATAAGLECVRADEIIHSGIIDVPMYKQLLEADVVVADLSTNNCNAFYELGVRHALRPYTTITIAEDKMTYPFDVNHIAIRKYRHLGEGIDYEEVERMRGELQKAMELIASQPTNDSPVYEFLRELKPPAFGAPQAAAVAAAVTGGLATGGQDQTASVLMERVEDAFRKSDFLTARSLLSVVRTLLPREPYVTQKLALATYKSKVPTPLEALEEARQILAALNPEISTDTETLGLLGAIRKRMWDETLKPEHLDGAIFGYEKGFNLKNDYYNGINLAFLYNVRASVAAVPEDAITDFVLAQRTRRKVIALCQDRLAAKPPESEKYWILATLAEAWAGLGDQAQAQQFLGQAQALAPAQWMTDSTTQQLETLKPLIDKSPLSRIA